MPLENLKLSQDQQNIVQAYGVLDQFGSGGGGDVQFSIVAGGQTHTIQATPELIQAFKQSLGWSLMGQSDSIQTPEVTFSKTQVAEALHIEPAQLDGLVAKEGASADAFTPADIMPWLSKSVGGASFSANQSGGGSGSVSA